MALDWTMLDARHQPIPLHDESTIMSIDRDSQVEFSLTIPDAPPSGTALIFTTPKEGKIKPSFESLSIPLDAVLSSKFEQPYFGANYLVLDIRPSPGGGLTDGTNVEIRFYDRGLFEFVSFLEKTRERVLYMRRQAAMEDDDNLLPHLPPGASHSYTDTPPRYVA
ncbi:hypothetical protein DFH29DRAFT_886512 [Suillus ampliporus]|nr:hypothetical protein DFH29DRAFT_886512 [Suillus ampliporus]